ncbi:MAG: hypothetical protein A2117_00085 [Candidatus Wildermuthbacteria bacterium GWA2_46_15]|uniref:Methyltransferase small domain-containing protein n=1 Tax=Candidatus Wildermuthbacteria bacterium GWA2_46_15 TaxID=1802443 RepID=A0A1G2QN90_9BACT|nr:MAG: hypothetical protein A2117_00085 [Candidatus Wildermuthbacteria bacterium GWA2_46_15]
MAVIECQFQDLAVQLFGKNRRATGISRSSRALSNIIPSLKNLTVLDLGCGVGYMTVGALRLGARRVVALDTEDIQRLLLQNVEINRFSPKAAKFQKSDLFSTLRKGIKFNVIVANLPQHALPATPSAKKLRGKYGGYDGTDLVCRALTEGAYYLKRGGRYFGSISRLTNFRRTMTIADSLYKIKIRKTITKTLDHNEMAPYLTDARLLEHLAALRKQGLIEYKINKHEQIEYKVHLCEFILK